MLRGSLTGSVPVLGKNYRNYKIFRVVLRIKKNDTNRKSFSPTLLLNFAVKSAIINRHKFFNRCYNCRGFNR